MLKNGLNIPLALEPGYDIIFTKGVKTYGWWRGKGEGYLYNAGRFGSVKVTMRDRVLLKPRYYIREGSEKVGEATLRYVRAI
jgi:hypothetical protein